MLPQPQTAAYHDRFNEALFHAVPAAARRVLDVGCGGGRLGLELKQQRPDRYVAGIEIDVAAAELASARIDDVYVVDVEVGLAPVEAGSFDCIVFGDVLEHLVNPEAALRRFRQLLAPGGSVVVSVPNLQHSSIVKCLVRGDFMYQPEGLLDATHLRFFTHMTFTKLMLDAGYLPRIEHRVRTGEGPETVERATPLLQLHGVSPAAAIAAFDTYQYVFSGTALDLPEQAFADEPISFVVARRDNDRLESNLRRSPALDPGTPHDLVVVPEGPSAAAYRRGLEQATGNLVVFADEDVYLPRGWDTQLVGQLGEAERRFGRLGVAGVRGWGADGSAATPVGRMIDGERLHDHSTALPTEVTTIDDAVLVLRRDSPLRFDEVVGSHLYGADIALQARASRLPAVVLDLPCLRNAPFETPSPTFHDSRRALLAKWPSVRPIHARDGRLDGMEENPPAPTWYDEYLDFPARLAAATERAAVLQATLDATEAELEDRRRHIANMEASVFWRARNAAHRALRRT